MIRWASFILISLMIGICSASGQSAPTNPPMTYGMVPTVGQWVGWFQQKQDVLSAAPLTVSGGTMLGRLNLFPSSTTQAGVNFGVGSTPTSPINGDMWVTATGAFIQVNGSSVNLGSGGGGGGGVITTVAGLTTAFPSP